MRWKEQILELTPYQPGKSIGEVKREYGLEKIVKLASNENPFGCSKEVLKAIRDFDSSFALYPDGYATELREALSQHLHIEQNQLIFGNGSDENIQIISRALLRPGYNTVMATPTFPQYKHNAILEGAEVREVPLVNGEHDLKLMLEAIDDRTNIVWLCSPNNPTGTYIDKTSLVEFLSKVPQETLVVLDEAYYEYVDLEERHNSTELINQFQNLIILRTFSKIYGLASFRVGYGMADAKLIRTLEPAREPFNTNTFAQLVAKAALKDQSYVEECRRRNREGLEQFYRFCQEKQLSYTPSHGNFILIDFKIDGNKVFQYLLQRGYIVRSGVALGFPTSVRITIGSKEQNSGILEEIAKFIDTPEYQAALLS